MPLKKGLVKYAKYVTLPNGKETIALYDKNHKLIEYRICKKQLDGSFICPNRNKEPIKRNKIAKQLGINPLTNQLIGGINREMIEPIVKEFKKYHLMVTGSYIRNHEDISDLDFLTFIPLNEIFKKLSEHHDIEILSKGTKKITFILDKKIHVDIWFIKYKYLLPFFRLEYDMGLANIKYKKLAKIKGFKLSINGLTDLKTNINYAQNFKTVKSIIKFLEND